MIISVEFNNIKFLEQFEKGSSKKEEVMKTKYVKNIKSLSEMELHQISGGTEERPDKPPQITIIPTKIDIQDHQVGGSAIILYPIDPNFSIGIGIGGNTTQGITNFGISGLIYL